MILLNTIFEYQEFGKFIKETIMNLLAIYFYNEGKTDNFRKHIYQLGRKKRWMLLCKTYILAKMEPLSMRRTSFNSNKC